MTATTGNGHVAGILAKLEAVMPTGSGWDARCPAHDDKNPSLSVSVGDDGSALLYCHAGCKIDSICDAIGMKKSDLFSREGKNGIKPTKTIETIYDYCDESGKLLRQKIRYAGKTWSQRKPDGFGGWSWKMGNARDVLYRLPELIKADPNEWVFVVEGEKDADLLVQLELVATTNIGGAGKWRDEYNRHLRGCKVCILPDHDGAGRKHAEQVARSLSGIASAVKVVELQGLTEKQDVSDYISKQGDNCDVPDLLIGLAEEADVRAALTVRNGKSMSSTRQVKPEPNDEFKPYAVLTCIDDVEEQDVEWLWDGMIPLGMLTMVTGDPGYGKSYACVSLAAHICSGKPMPGTTISTEPASCIYLAGEDDVARTIKKRMRGSGYTNNGKFHLLDGIQRKHDAEYPDNFNLEGDCRYLEDIIKEIGDVKMVVIDTLDCFVGTSDTNNATETRAITTQLSRLAERYNLAIVAVRHLNKKSGDKAIHRVAGSVAWVGASRACFVVAPDPDDETKEQRLWACVKMNIARQPDTLCFRIGNGYRLEWGDTVDKTADDILTPQRPERSHKTIDEVGEWLCRLVSNGPVRASDVHGAADVKGYADKTVRRAKDRCGIVCRMMKLDGDERKVWYWSLAKLVKGVGVQADQTDQVDQA